MLSSSVKILAGHLCDCQGCMNLYQCKKGSNKGRFFLEMTILKKDDDTCDLFIYDEYMREKAGNEDGAI